MTAENVSHRNENHDAEPKRRISRLDSNALIRGLERLRERVEQRLVRLEAVAVERAVAPAHDPSELEQKLQRRIADIEEAKVQLRAAAERREQEWQTAFEQLEGDRKLLAEAWDRLERERIETVPTTQGLAPGRLPMAGREAAPLERPRPRPEMADPAHDSVTLAILQQFQTLRSDVRRNARRRGTL
jgi:DNA repair exonuclease SbcCD ATPase subunit